jgi:hypothetical protein
MAQPLFIEPDLHFEKLSAETSLPEDPNQWPNEILQQLYKEIPYVADFEPQIIMDKVDAERGFGFGHVEVGNRTEAPQPVSPDQADAAGLKKVRIPVIVKEGKLLPFDILVTEDSKMMPLTESRLRQAIFRPQAFDVTSKTPGDQSMIGQLYPPYRQNYGFGGGGVTTGAGGGGKTAAAARKITDFALKHGLVSPGGITGKGLVAAGAGATGIGLAGRAAMGKPMLGGEKKAAARDVELEGGANDLEAWLTAEAEELPKEANGDMMQYFRDHPEKLKEKLEREKKASELFKTGSVLEGILPTINVSDHAGFMDALEESPELQAAFMKNAASTADSLKLLAEYEPMGEEKRAAILPTLIPPSVLQLSKAEDGYTIKTASHTFWAPYEESIDRGEAIRRCGEKVVLAADTTGTATVGEEGVGGEETEQEVENATEGAPPAASEDPLPEKGELITSPGNYKVQTAEGKELMGLVVPNLLDLDGNVMPLALFTNGSQSTVQGEIVGVKSGEATSTPWCEMHGKGAFCSTSDGKLIATIPINIKGTYSVPSQSAGQDILAETFDGRQVTISIQPGLKKIVSNGEKVLVPDCYKWLPLEDSEEVTLVDNPADFGLQSKAKQAASSVTLRCSGHDFALDGLAVDKLAADERQFLSQDDALFLLSGLGANLGYARSKLAEAFSTSQNIPVRIGRYLKLASEVRKEASAAADAYLGKLPVLRTPLWKEAAVIPDPVAVDTVLSLGFVNPENIAHFIGYLPVIDEAQQKMSELLLASRLGLREVPEGALEKAVRATEEVIEGLKVIAFQE